MLRRISSDSGSLGSGLRNKLVRQQAFQTPQKGVELPALGQLGAMLFS